jgi:hypothetical protein
MELWSTVFLAEDLAEPDWATAALEVGEWRRVTEEQGEVGRIFAEIRFGGGDPLYVALGAPVQPPRGGGPDGQSGGTAQRLYLPSWMLETLGCNGCGELATVEWYGQEAFPAATRLVLRPHDSAFYYADAKEELERALTRLGVVKRGTSITLPLECLGGYEVTFDVLVTEPASSVLAEGDEVVMEFEEALDAAVAVPAAPVPPPVPVQAEADLSGQMIPERIWTPPAPEPQGRQLGGGAERRMPDGTRWNPWRHGPWVGP